MALALPRQGAAHGGPGGDPARPFDQVASANRQAAPGPTFARTAPGRPLWPPAAKLPHLLVYSPPPGTLPLRLVLPWCHARRRLSLYPLGGQWLEDGAGADRPYEPRLLRLTRGTARRRNAAPTLLPPPSGHLCSRRACAHRRACSSCTWAQRGQAGLRGVAS